jgi:hypothetical protein
MSQHNITGSEVFGPKPLVIVRSVRAGAFRRRRGGRTAVIAFVAGAVVAVVGVAVAIAAVFGTTLFG